MLTYANTKKIVHLTDIEKGSIEILHTKGYTMSDTAEDINRYKITVSRYLKKLKHPKVPKKIGRKPKLSQQTISLLLRTASNDASHVMNSCPN